MKTRIIGVVSGKGGVGKTTTTSNLGAALSTLRKNTLLVDGNLTTPNLSLHLGIPFYPYTIHEILKGEAELEDAIFYHRSGLKVLPASLSLSALRKINLRKFGELLRSLEGKTEYVVVDSSPGLGKETQAIIEHSDELIVVTNPEFPAITDALKVIKLAESVGTSVIGVVVNRVRRHPKEIPKEEIEGLLEYPVIANIPEDPKVHVSIIKKTPIVFSYPNSSAARAFKQLAGFLAGEEVKEKRSILDVIFSFFRR